MDIAGFFSGKEFLALFKLSNGFMTHTRLIKAKQDSIKLLMKDYIARAQNQDFCPCLALTGRLVILFPAMLVTLSKARK